MCTNLALSTLGARHDKAGVGQVALAVLGAVDIGAATLHLDASCLDGGVYGNGVGTFGLFGSTVALDLPTFGITGQRGKHKQRKICERNFPSSKETPTSFLLFICLPPEFQTRR